YHDDGLGRAGGPRLRTGTPIRRRRREHSDRHRPRHSGVYAMKRLGAGLIALLVLGPTVRGGQDPAERSPTAAKDGRGAVGADAPPTPDAVRRAPLRFPADRAIGVLYTRARAARDWPGGDWERLGEATGEVAIPPGRQVRLDLGAGAGADLAPLRRLGPDDL